jgi:cell division protein FtsB
LVRSGIHMARRATQSAANTDRVAGRRPRRRFQSQAAFLAACIILANGLIGERGLTETIHARRAIADASRELSRLRHENEELRNTAQRLRDDPATIESVARAELGLARRGEVLVVIRESRQ